MGINYSNSTRRPSPTSKPAGTTTSQPARKPRPKVKEVAKRQSMLNTHRLSPFKYDMNEVLAASAMDEAKASAFLASVIAKASRQSTREAKDFVRTFVDSGDLTKEEYDRISRLLDKYSKYR